MKLCMATNNRHKLEEISHALGGTVELVTLEDIGCFEELAEDQNTLEGNSLQKAEYVFKNYGAYCFADDTGLEVEALNGEPGVYSARYAGSQRNSEDNMKLLLRNLRGSTNKNAQFRTVITLMVQSGTHQFEGILKGTIIPEPRGNMGFGYDPIFLPEGYSKTLAELTLEEKNKISHRARAIARLADFLRTAPR